MSERDPNEPVRADAPAELTSTDTFEEGEEAAPRGVLVMAVVRWGIVLVMALVAALSLSSFFAQRSSSGHTHVQAEQYYCPMHPSVVQDHPGDCPICNMTLVLRPESTRPSASMAMPEVAAHPERPVGLAPIELPPERVQLMGMRTARVLRDASPASLRAVGTIAATESAVSSVQLRVSGWVQELLVSSSGEPVKRGQLLARIYSPELLSAQQELLNARGWQAGGSTAGGQTSLIENAHNRLLLMGMDPGELAEVVRTGQAHRLFELRSPTRGYVAEKQALLGLYVQPGGELFRIADLSKVWALIDVYERDAGRLAVGQHASVTLPSYPGQVFRGTVSFVYPALNTETRTLRARVELKNPDFKLKPGMFGTVLVSTPNSADAGVSQALSIPREALVDMGEHQYVFVEREPGHFEPRLVQVGARAVDSVQIVSGLSENETVVTTGNFLLDSESRLRTAVAGQ